MRKDLEAVLSPPEQRGLAVGVAERLREAILNGHFGPGERLREEALASALGVSRGPIREALARLEREGLIVIRRNRGAIVAQLAREDLDEVYTLRVAIERLAVQRAIEMVTDDEIARMQEIVDEIAIETARGITEKRAAELDIRFHDLIYQAAHHRRLYDCWATLRPQIHILFLNRNVANPDFRDYVVASHQEIVDALHSREIHRAVRMIEEHLRGSYERIVQRHSQPAPRIGDGRTGSQRHDG